MISIKCQLTNGSNQKLTILQIRPYTRWPYVQYVVYLNKPCKLRHQVGSSISITSWLGCNVAIAVCFAVVGPAGRNTNLNWCQHNLAPQFLGLIITCLTMPRLPWTAEAKLSLSDQLWPCIAGRIHAMHNEGERQRRRANFIQTLYFPPPQNSAHFCFLSDYYFPRWGKITYHEYLAELL